MHRFGSYLCLVILSLVGIAVAQERPIGGVLEYGGVVPGRVNRPPRLSQRQTANRLVTWPGFQPLVDGGSRFFVQTTKPVQTTVESSRERVVVILRDVRIHLDNNRRPLETRYFNTPVTRARVERRRRDVALVLELRASVAPIVRTEQGADGLHFVFADFASGHYLPVQSSPVTIDAGTTPPSPPTTDTSMDNERPPGFGM